MNSSFPHASATPIYLPSKLGWNASVDARIELYRATIANGSKNVVLDFSRVKNAYPNGVVPIIALVDKYRRDGVVFDLLPPTHAETQELFAANGWLHFICPDKWPAEAANVNLHLPLRRFEDDRDLNVVVSQVIEICLQQNVFAEGVPQAFEWALNEIAGNILEHSKAAVGWIQVTAYPNSGSLALIVCDSGIGVRHSMKRKFWPKTDVQALELAIQKGVSSIDDCGRGNGLAGAIAIARHNKGLFVLISGHGRIKVYESGKTESNGTGPNYFGTCVEMQFVTQTKIDLPQALWGHNPVSYIEQKFENDCGELILTLREYASSFGNRITGEKMRNVITNLLVQNPRHTVRIGMEGIEVVSSSFADELFGKLIVELGSPEFSQRVRFKGLTVLCKQIIDDSISQRMALNT